MKSFQKSKSRETKGQNAAGPKYRTPATFRANFFGGKKLGSPQLKFNPGQFKVQHKG